MKHKRYVLLVLNCVIFALVQASPLAVVQGGTGLTSVTAYAVLCAGTTGSSTFQPVAGVGTAGQILSLSASGALPSFTSINREYAHIYTKGASQTINALSAYLFDSNGLISSGITHSTSSNTDQIIINTTGTYWFMFTGSSTSGAIYLSITINGTIDAASQFLLGSSGGFQVGQFIANITAGQIIRVVNWNSSSITINGSSTKVAASIVIRQIS